MVQGRVLAVRLQSMANDIHVALPIVSPCPGQAFALTRDATDPGRDPVGACGWGRHAGV